jgi:hypothetical protein
MPKFWNLAGVNPNVIRVLLLILTYDRFLGQIVERSFHPMILGSAIVPHFFALLEDTRDFPFFARSDRLSMLAHGSLTLYLIRAICGRTTRVDRRFHLQVMPMIIKSVVRGILRDPVIASSLALSFSAIMTYPLGPYNAGLCLSINPRLSPDCTIWQIISIVSVLPGANAIRRISTEGFTPSQQENYDNVHFLENIRQLILSENKVLILVCKFFHKQKKSSVNQNSFFCEEFEKLRRTPDFQEFMKCMISFTVTFFQPQDHKQLDCMLCWRVVEVFYTKMTACNWNFMSMLLRENDEDSVLKLLEEGCPVSEVDRPLSFSLSFPDNFADSSGLRFLSILRSGIHSLRSLRKKKNVLKELLKALGKKKNSRFTKDAKSQIYRIMLLLCKFIKFIKSDSPHRDFIISCILFLKSNQEVTFRYLSIYLDLLNMDSSRVCDFYSIFSDFCNFADQSMHCAEMTKKSFLCFFDLMRDVLSHERFMKRFSNLLTKISNTSSDEVVKDFAVCISDAPGNYTFLRLVQPFKFTICSKCDKHLSDDNYLPSLRLYVDGDDLCDNCFDEENGKFFASGPKRW